MTEDTARQGTDDGCSDLLRRVLGTLSRGAELLLPALVPMYERMNPDNVGGAALVGVNGVCMISHGSSSANAIFSAIKAAHELAETDMVGQLVAALGDHQVAD